MKEDTAKKVLVLVLLFVALWVDSTRRFGLCLTWCYFVLVFFSPFSIAITSLGEERANLICACLVLLVSSSSWCLRRTAVCACDTSWTFLLPFCFFLNKLICHDN